MEMRLGMHRVIATLHRMDKPVVAAVNGAAVAGGLTLALACDFRIAADTAKLGDTSGKFALLPDEGGALFFPRMMGLDRALKMSLLAETYPAAEALKLGLVTEVVPAAGTRSAVARFRMQALASRAPLAVRLAKNMMRKGLDSSLEASLDDAALVGDDRQSGAGRSRRCCRLLRQTRAEIRGGVEMNASAAMLPSLTLCKRRGDLGAFAEIGGAGILWIGLHI